ncbi:MULTISPECIES: DUF1190 domain-containing protein [unclassified Novosphingobium]|uniref:DUF1190 domain-containing protein n=1 Tax=unclassified Novosphingobium TaxID=2644732 RepID=UPI0025D18440|nr:MULTISPECIES: DUF1190 domain-containing protein [unclassified Novosphingobium]
MAGLGSAMLLAGCGTEAPAPSPEDSEPKQEVLAFENQFECKANSGLSEEECAAARKQAVEVAAQTAPRFADSYDCEAEWGQGNCIQQSHAGQSFFMPFVGGFILGKVLAGNSRDVVPLFRKTKDGPLQTANGVRLGYGGAPGKYVASARAFEKPASIPKIASASAAASRGGLTKEEQSNGRVRGFGVVRAGG